MYAYLKEMVEAVVDCPEEVVVRVLPEDKAVIYQIYVSPQDVGKVVGKQGRIINAIRTLMKANGRKQKSNVTVEVIEGKGTIAERALV